MDLGLGLPIGNPGCLPDWARRAEAAGFASLALLDRLAYDNPEPLVALAVLAGVTTRVRLQTEVLLGPLRGTALLAKQVATLDRMSGGWSVSSPSRPAHRRPWNGPGGRSPTTTRSSGGRVGARR
ncbi:LLM class flavin-dependent oxidoreductase [Micromonospora mangrovi]|uniref:LLM class flavin-dependent oxidoreductase n=2 Tax=Micromonospora TaxID=1873 RepID=A0AAU8HMM9_9ACTN